MTIPKVEARPAATVMLIKDGEAGIEVLMVRRPARGFFGGLTVFPGGAVDPVDSSELASSVVADDGSDRPYRVAAVRELAEETGLAVTRNGVMASPSGRGEALLTALAEAGIQLDGSALTLVSRWVTPEDAPVRFDTCFFLAGVTETPEVRLDTEELVDHAWITPTAALAMGSTGGLQMFLPTIAHLRWLERWADVERAVAEAEDADGRCVIQPRRMRDGSLVPIIFPSEV